jgi:hypothetical protein
VASAARLLPANQKSKGKNQKAKVKTRKKKEKQKTPNSELSTLSPSP